MNVGVDWLLLCLLLIRHFSGSVQLIFPDFSEFRLRPPQRCSGDVLPSPIKTTRRVPSVFRLPTSNTAKRDVGLHKRETSALWNYRIGTASNK
jgi:hypothetical protein